MRAFAGDYSDVRAGDGTIGGAGEAQSGKGLFAVRYL